MARNQVSLEGSARPRTRSRASARLTEADRQLLAFAAEHRFILGAHARTLLGVSAGAATTRLRSLTRAGWLASERKLVGPGCYQITRRGLDAIGSSRARPREVDLATYDHEVGLAWLWLAAGRGAFGSLVGIASERHMRSEDRRRDEPADRLGVKLPGVGPYGGERRHYPDLLLDTASGHRVAVELELTPKGRARRSEILGGYALDGRIDGVLYMVEDERTGSAIERSARAAGIADRVGVQLVRYAPGSGAIGDRRGGPEHSMRAPRREGQHSTRPSRREGPSSARGRGRAAPGGAEAEEPMR